LLHSERAEHAVLKGLLLHVRQQERVDQQDRQDDEDTIDGEKYLVQKHLDCSCRLHTDRDGEAPRSLEVDSQCFSGSVRCGLVQEIFFTTRLVKKDIQ